MAQTFHSLLANAGGRVEFLFFIHGLPWSVATHADVATALRNTADASVQAYRKKLFGQVSATVNGTTTTPAYSVPIFDTLLPDGLGAQTVQHNTGKGLDVGSWSVDIACEDLGHTYTHRSGTIWGLEGLDVVPSDRYDTSICMARISRKTLNNGNTLYFDSDIGDKLSAKITANWAARVPTYLYVGTQLLLARSDVTDIGGPNGEYSVTVSFKGLKTAAQHIFPEDYESNNAPVSDAPIGGIAGRPATLYAIPMDKDGNIIDMSAGPVRFREGPCMPSSVEKNGRRKVSVHGWKQWLEHDVQANYATASPRGFMFSRDAGSNDQSPHMVIYEWTGAAWATRDIWLCTAGSNKWFENYDMLCDYLTEYLAALYGATTISNLYAVDHQLGPVIDAGGTAITAGNYSRLGGPLPWLLGWGAYDPSQIAYYSSTLLDTNPFFRFESNTDAAISSSGIPQLYVYDSDGSTADDSYREFNFFSRAQYIIQYGWNNADAAEHPKEHHPRSFPMPKVTGDSSYRLYIDLEKTASDFAVGEEILIGDPARIDVNGVPIAGKFVIEATDDTDNYLDIEDSPLYDFSTDTPDSSGIACIRSITEEAGHWAMGGQLMYHPVVHTKQDPWVMRERLYIQDTNPVRLLRGLLGASSTATDVFEKYQVTHMPNAYDNGGAVGSDDYYDGFNWDQLEALFESSQLSGADFVLFFDSAFNMSKIYHELLKMWQIEETWGYNNQIRGFQIGFKRAGLVNLTLASNEGRIIDAGVRVANDVPSNMTADSWLYTKIDANFNYSDVDKKFLTQVVAEDKSGRALGAGSGSVLKIEDKVTRFQDVDLEQVRQHFGSALKAGSVPYNAQSVQCTTEAIVRLGVNKEALVTDTTARSPYTGAKGITDQPALVTKMSINLSGSPGVGVAYRFAPDAVRGWAPALYLTGGEITLNGTDVEIATTTDPADNDFADPNGGMTDLEFFDCLQYNESTDLVEAKPSCSCGDYAVIVFDHGVTALDNATPGRNYWTGTIGSVDGDAGTAVIALANADDFDDSTAKIVIFNTYDNCEDCQQNYLFFADSTSQIGAGNAVGGRWA